MARTTTVHLLTGDYSDRLEVLWSAAKNALNDKTPKTLLDADAYDTLKADYDVLKAEAIEAGITVHLTGIGRQVWRSLKEKYPARSGEGVDPDVAKQDRIAGLNADAVEDDLIYLSIKAWEKESGETDPRVSSRAVFAEWADELSEGEWATLTVSAWDLANGARLDPKELPSSPTRSDG